jgi:hypothetical protein
MVIIFIYVCKTFPYIVKHKRFRASGLHILAICLIEVLIVGSRGWLVSVCKKGAGDEEEMGVL